MPSHGVAYKRPPMTKGLWANFSSVPIASTTTSSFIPTPSSVAVVTSWAWTSLPYSSSSSSSTITIIPGTVVSIPISSGAHTSLPLSSVTLSVSRFFPISTPRVFSLPHLFSWSCILVIIPILASLLLIPLLVCILFSIIPFLWFFMVIFLISLSLLLSSLDTSWYLWGSL